MEPLHGKGFTLLQRRRADGPPKSPSVQYIRSPGARDEELLDDSLLCNSAGDIAERLLSSSEPRSPLRTRPLDAPAQWPAAQGAAVLLPGWMSTPMPGPQAPGPVPNTIGAPTAPAGGDHQQHFLAAPINNTSKEFVSNLDQVTAQAVQNFRFKLQAAAVLSPRALLSPQVLSSANGNSKGLQGAGAGGPPPGGDHRVRMAGAPPSKRSGGSPSKGVVLSPKTTKAVLTGQGTSTAKSSKATAQAGDHQQSGPTATQERLRKLHPPTVRPPQIRPATLRPTCDVAKKGQQLFEAMKFNPRSRAAAGGGGCPRSKNSDASGAGLVGPNDLSGGGAAGAGVVSGHSSASDGPELVSSVPKMFGAATSTMRSGSMSVGQPVRLTLGRISSPFHASKSSKTSKTSSEDQTAPRGGKNEVVSATSRGSTPVHQQVAPPQLLKAAKRLPTFILPTGSAANGTGISFPFTVGTPPLGGAAGAYNHNKPVGRQTTSIFVAPPILSTTPSSGGRVGGPQPRIVASPRATSDGSPRRPKTTAVVQKRSDSVTPREKPPFRAGGSVHSKAVAAASRPTKVPVCGGELRNNVAFIASRIYLSQFHDFMTGTAPGRF